MSYVGLDETGRIQSVTEKAEYAAPGAIEFEFPEGFDLTRIDDFLIRDGRLVESPREPDSQQLIAEYKAKLSATDYMAVKLAEASVTGEELPSEERERYIATIAQRREWRARINELEETGDE